MPFSESLPPSKREYPIRGLNLIRLLTQNRIADFHTTLESIDSDIINDNPFIRHPVNLERWLMEGSYSKVWNAREEAPAEEYKFFVDSLMGTIRYFSFIYFLGVMLLILALEMKLPAVKKLHTRASPSKMQRPSCSLQISLSY